MRPVTLRSARLVLDQPGEDDVDDIARHCRDPLFERYLTTPWPYRRRHAKDFVQNVVVPGWAEDREYTWALRREEGRPLIGVIGWRSARSDVGFWLGADHRGRGLMAEALGAVADWLFAQGVAVIRWECRIGNAASARTARAVGFRYTGEAPINVPARDGSHPLGWHAELTPISPRTVRPGWPG